MIWAVSYILMGIYQKNEALKIAKTIIKERKHKEKQRRRNKEKNERSVV